MHALLLIGAVAVLLNQANDTETAIECPVVAKGDKYVIHAVPGLHDGGLSLTHTDRGTGKVRVFFSTWTQYHRSTAAIDWHTTTWTQVTGIAADDNRLYVLVRRDGDGLGLGAFMKKGTTLQVYWREDASRLGSYHLQDDEGVKPRFGDFKPHTPKTVADLVKKGDLVVRADGVAVLGHEFHFDGKKLNKHVEPNKQDKK